jgi:hypothetical protein
MAEDPGQTFEFLRELLANGSASFETAGEYRMLNEEDARNFARSQDAGPFLFAPESEMWRINRERCGLICGPAAAILQIAHPRIAQAMNRCHPRSGVRLRPTTAAWWKATSLEAIRCAGSWQER